MKIVFDEKELNKNQSISAEMIVKLTRQLENERDRVKLS